MVIEIVYETHSTTVDNEQGRATGWLPGELSERGRAEARALGSRRRDDGITAVFCSDLGRAVETVSIALGGSDIPVLHDWRLREWDCGQRPYPGGEGGRQAVARVGRFLGDLPLSWEGQRVLVVGHVATRWGVDHFLGGMRLEDLAEEDFAWQPGWEYRLG